MSPLVAGKQSQSHLSLSLYFSPLHLPHKLKQIFLLIYLPAAAVVSVAVVDQPQAN